MAESGDSGDGFVSIIHEFIGMENVKNALS